MAVDCVDPNVLYAGTVRSGVVRSTDGGRTWQPINAGLTRREVWWPAQHPTTGELWAGVSPAAIFKSTDRGGHWRECEAIQRLVEGVPDPLAAAPRSVVGDPLDPKRVDVGMTDGMIWRTGDGHAFEPALRLAEHPEISEPHITALTVVH